MGLESVVQTDPSGGVAEWRLLGSGKLRSLSNPADSVLTYVRICCSIQATTCSSLSQVQAMRAQDGSSLYVLAGEREGITRVPPRSHPPVTGWQVLGLTTGTLGFCNASDEHDD